MQRQQAGGHDNRGAIELKDPQQVFGDATHVLD
jgi:hypothetical protein